MIEGMKERGDMVRLDDCIKVGHNIGTENYMWKDPVDTNDYDYARFDPTSEVPANSGIHFISLVPDAPENATTDGKFLRNGQRVCLRAENVHYPGFNYMYT
jgi:hypothetical protein